jgi:hypothetical protein
MLELINYDFVFNVDIAAYPDSVNVLDGTSLLTKEFKFC